MITKTADGLEIKGGQSIVFQGRVRANARNGVFIDSANVSDVKVHDSFITGNNIGNDPDGNGFYLASPSKNISLLNSTVSNFPKKTGAQRYGVKIAAPGATNLQIENNDLTDNSEGPLANESAGLYSVWGNRPDGINFLPDARIGKLTTHSCFSIASPANCGSASAGSVAVPGIRGTEIVKTTAVTAEANSSNVRLFAWPATRAEMQRNSGPGVRKRKGTWRELHDYSLSRKQKTARLFFLPDRQLGPDLQDAARFVFAACIQARNRKLDRVTSGKSGQQCKGNDLQI